MLLQLKVSEGRVDVRFEVPNLQPTPTKLERSRNFEFATSSQQIRSTP